METPLPEVSGKRKNQISPVLKGPEHNELLAVYPGTHTHLTHPSFFPDR